MTADASLRAQVAWSCRILAMHGHADMTLGHVSARGQNETLWIKRKDLGLDEITPKDVIGMSPDGEHIAGEGQLHLESALHTEVYRARADVHAVIHTHPPYTIALGATTTALEFLNHDGILFHDGIGIFEDTAGLIDSRQLGEQVAIALGTCRAVLLRNHGVLVVGTTVAWATYTALVLERAAQIQLIAQGFGDLAPLSETMASNLFPEKYRDDLVESYWRYLIRKVRRAGLDADMPLTTDE